MASPARSQALILLAFLDDEQDLYDCQLRYDGFRTALALDDEDLLHKARTMRPNVIVFGQRRPPRGDEGCTMLKNDPVAVHIPVVMISSYHVQGCRADQILVRPVLPDTLSKRLSALLQTRGVA